MEGKCQSTRPHPQTFKNQIVTVTSRTPQPSPGSPQARNQIKPHSTQPTPPQARSLGPRFHGRAAQAPRVSYRCPPTQRAHYQRRRPQAAAPDDPKNKTNKTPQENAREHSTRPPVPCLPVPTTRRWILHPPRRLAGDPAAGSAEVGRLLPFPLVSDSSRLSLGRGGWIPCSRSSFFPLYLFVLGRNPNLPLFLLGLVRTFAPSGAVLTYSSVRVV